MVHSHDDVGLNKKKKAKIPNKKNFLKGWIKTVDDYY